MAFLLVVPGFFVYLLVLLIGVVNMVALRRYKRSGGQSPPRPAQFGETPEGERDGGPGNDLILCEARRAPMPVARPGIALPSASGG